MFSGEKYDEKADIWALGVLLYELSALQPPFTANDMASLQKNICRLSTPRLPRLYSNELQSFVEKCLQKDPNVRPSAQQLLEENIFKNKIK